MSPKPIQQTVRKPVERSSNFEWLRLLSILMIIAFHYCIHGDGGWSQLFESSLSVNHAIAVILGSWGILGVNSFVFISAYFLLDKSKVNTHKIVQILVQTTCYTLLITLMLKLVFKVELTNGDIGKALLFPIYNEDYWFITAYCMLYLIHPFLNTWIKALSDQQLGCLVLVLTLLVAGYFTLPSVSSRCDLFFMIYLYMVMGYLKRKPQFWMERYAKIGLFISLLTAISINLGMTYLGDLIQNHKLHTYSTLLSGRFSPLMVVTAIFLFYCFKNLKVKNSHLINSLAGMTLSIYLIHENPLMVHFLWDPVLKINEVYQTGWFGPHLILSTLGIFLSCVLVESIRSFIAKFLIKPFPFIYQNRLWRTIDRAINS